MDGRPMQTFRLNVVNVPYVGLSVDLAGGFLPEYKMWGMEKRSAIDVGMSRR